MRNYQALLNVTRVMDHIRRWQLFDKLVQLDRYVSMNYHVDTPPSHELCIAHGWGGGCLGDIFYTVPALKMLGTSTCSKGLGPHTHTLATYANSLNQRSLYASANSESYQCVQLTRFCLHEFKTLVVEFHKQLNPVDY